MHYALIIDREEEPGFSFLRFNSREQETTGVRTVRITASVITARDMHSDDAAEKIMTRSV